MSSGRRLAAVCLALLGGAVGLWVATRLSWFTTAVEAVGRGPVRVSADGTDVVPALAGLALLAAAAIPAAVALAGVLRRALGVLVAAGGALAGWRVATALVNPPSAADLATLPGAPAGGTAAAGPVALGPGPIPAAVGAALLVVAGVVLLIGERRLPRFGGRFARERRQNGPARAPSGRGAEPDRAAWDALDAGRDPTLDSTSSGNGEPGASVPGRTDREPPAGVD